MTVLFTAVFLDPCRVPGTQSPKQMNKHMAAGVADMWTI